VRLERKKHLDEAQKADDIEYILRKYPHLRIAYVDERTVGGEKIFASVLVKAAGPLPGPDQSEAPATMAAGYGATLHNRHAQLLAQARAEKLRQEELAADPQLPVSARGDGQLLGAGVLLDDVDLDKAGGLESARKALEQGGGAWPGVGAGAGAVGATITISTGSGADASDIQEVYRIRLPGNVLIGEGKPENQNHAMIFTRGEFLEGQSIRRTWHRWGCGAGRAGTRRTGLCSRCQSLTCFFLFSSFSLISLRLCALLSSIQPST
jgi:hypothetical protein